jgi:nitrile hydratase accessory protein
MSATPDQRIGQMDGSAALPRSNGELVFTAPWEGRAFGIAVALYDKGVYPWRDFRDRLVAEIAAAESARIPSSYYERWLASLEKLVIAREMITPAELDARTAEYLSGQRDDDE